MRRVFTTRSFARWARREGLRDAVLCDAVAEMECGLVDADLGGGVFKKRVPLAGRGKRGGARVLVATRRDGRWFFVYGFLKSERENVEARELAALQLLAAALLGVTIAATDTAIRLGELTEICHEAKPAAH